MAIYTRKGDKGDTGLLGGSRISKDSLKVSCYGTLDEANAALGVAYPQIDDKEIRGIIKEIQKQLIDVGAELAGDEKGRNLLKNQVGKTEILRLEAIIDKYEQELGPLNEFIIPGETAASASLHLSRAIVRRTERLIVKLAKESTVREEIFQYVNRLSDLLFILARAEVHSRMVEAIKNKVLEKMTARKKRDTDLSLQLAVKMAEAAETKATSMGVPIVFSVVDNAGNMILLHRMEGSLLASLDIAPNKAYTAVALKIATHELVPVIQPGSELYGIQLSNQNKIITFGGGYPLKTEDYIIGGIGVSGGTVAEDMSIAEEALKFFDIERRAAN
jgi:ATP:cob(I)alamin adenosyltransferase